MNSSYIEVDKVDEIKKSKSFFKKAIVLSFIFSTLIGLFGFGLFSSMNTQKVEDNHVANADIVQWIMCDIFGQDSLAAGIYNWTQGTDVQFFFLSKSYQGSSEDSVDFGLNSALDFVRTKVAGMDSYRTFNENIVGQSLDNTDPTDEIEYNAGKGYGNPFDRFGVSGLKFTSYSGEWKSYAVDACNDVVQDRNANKFYTARLEPKSTWDDIASSQDPRTQLFSVGLTGRFDRALTNNIANWIFNITKVIIVFVIVMIGFAFADIPSFMGITDIIAGNPETGTTGIYSSLHNNLFVPLIVLIFILTGLWIAYQGIVKRQYRTAMTGGIRSIVLFIIAIAIAMSPAWFISLPNNVALVGQGLVGSALAKGQAAGTSLCTSAPESTGKSRFDINTSNYDTSDLSKSGEWLENLSKQMQSQTGCLLWNVFLVNPWLQGQWGTSNLSDLNYSNLGNSDANKNAIGFCPVVPLGDGYYLQINGDDGPMHMDEPNSRPADNPVCADSNWAIFQISTQTNAHAATQQDTQGQKPKYSQGVANEWWAIVDAVSNYSETNFSGTENAIDNNAIAGNNPNVGEDNRYNLGRDENELFGGGNNYEDQDNAEQVTKYWDVWTGQQGFERIGVAMLSVPVALLGTIAPMIFAFLSAMYALGLAIMMTFAPIMFLLGCWANRGYDIFKSWGQMVLNLVMKRIAVGLLLMFSLVIVSIIFHQIFNGVTEWYQGILELIIISFVLIKSRGLIIKMFTFFRFAGDGMSQISSNIGNKFKNTSNTVGKVGVAAGFGGISAKRRGAKFSEGAFAGVKTQITNMSYQSQISNSARLEKDKLSGISDPKNRYCDFCGQQIGPDEYVVYSQTSALEGGTGFMHYDPCSFQSGYEDLEYIGEISKKDSNAKQESNYNTKQAKNSLRKLNKGAGEDPQYSQEFRETGTLTDEDLRFVFDKIVSIEDLIVKSYKDVKNAESDRDTQTAPVPQEILPYIDQDAYNLAWEEGNSEYLAVATAVGWKNYTLDTFSNDERVQRVFQSKKKEIAERLMSAMQRGTFYDENSGSYEELQEALEQEFRNFIDESSQTDDEKDK